MTKSSQLDRSKTSQTGPQQKQDLSAQPIPSETQCGSRDFYGGMFLGNHQTTEFLIDYIRQDFEVHLGDKDAHLLNWEFSYLNPS